MNFRLENLNGRYFTETYNDYEFGKNDFELIEEQQDIEIQEIEELDIYEENVTKGNMIDKINELVEAVKELDRKMKENK